MPRQAVVFIHGMGDRQPMTLLRQLARAVVPAPGDGRVPYFSRPDRLSGTYELRRFKVPARDGEALPETDLYELYWAHLMAGNRLRHVASLVRAVMLRVPWRVPGALRSLWALLWASALAVGLGWFVYAWCALNPGQTSCSQAMSVLGAPWMGVLATAGVLGLDWLVTTTFVDVARYLHPHPENVAVRQAIRDQAVGLLRALHVRGGYDRIVVVGHSLGSIIGMEAIHLLWAEVSAAGHDLNQEKPQALMAWQERAGELEAAHDAPRGVRARALARYRRAQGRLWLEQIERGSPWRISDFVSLGSPLAYAELLMADRGFPLEERIAYRQLPACPPAREEPLFGDKTRYIASYVARFDGDAPPGERATGFAMPAAGLPGNGNASPDAAAADADRHRPRRVLHHAAAFGPTRWTNLWYPARLGVFGDWFAGPLAPVFGCGIRDRPIRRGSWRRRLPVWPHVRYLDGFTRDPSGPAQPGSAVWLLRRALGLWRRELVQQARAASQTKIDINRASAERLERLHGVGPALAARIVADRESRGAFGSVEELVRVPGLGAAGVDRIARSGLVVVGESGAGTRRARPRGG